PVELLLAAGTTGALALAEREAVPFPRAAHLGGAGAERLARRARRWRRRSEQGLLLLADRNVAHDAPGEPQEEHGSRNPDLHHDHLTPLSGRHAAFRHANRSGGRLSRSSG